MLPLDELALEVPENDNELVRDNVALLDTVVESVCVLVEV